MPTIKNDALYNAVFSAARSFLEQNALLVQRYTKVYDVGTPLYRYVNYRNLLPQQEAAGKTIWTSLKDDKNNRWTGLGADSGTSFSGLYMSMENNGGLDTSFAELMHYQNQEPAEPATQKIAYFNYEPGQSPKFMQADAGKLRSMFLYTLNEPVSGVQLLLTDSKGNPGSDNEIIEGIYQEVKQSSPGIIPLDKNAASMYNDSGDASFTRAIGNAVFMSVQGCEFIETTSVRGGNSSNLVLRGEPNKPLGMLKPEGRGSFYIDSAQKTTKAVYTIDDMLYNRKFAETGLGLIMPKDAVVKELSDFDNEADKINAAIDWTYGKQATDSAITQYVNEKLTAMDSPFASNDDALAARLLTLELEESISAAISSYADSSAQTYDGYPALYNKIGLEGIHSLLADTIVQNKMNTIRESSANATSYLSMQVREVVASKRAHWLAEESSGIQRRLADLDVQQKNTSDEIKQKSGELTDVKQKLKDDPGNQNLQDQSHKIQKEIEEATKRQEQEQDEAKILEQDKQDNRGAAADAEREKATASERAKQRGIEIFGE